MWKKLFKNKYSFTLIIFILTSSLIYCFSIKKNNTNKIYNISTNIISFISTPFQKGLYKISYNVNHWFSTTFKGKKLQQENVKLQSEINNLRKQLVEFNKYKIQNQELLKLLKIKDSYSSLQLTSGLVIGKISNDPFKSFIIDKGSRDNIKLHDCVITPEGLIGYIDKIYINSSVVKTILHEDTAIGIYNTNNSESGILTGTIELAYKNMAKMKYLSRQSSAKPDDIIITSGISDNFPKGILIGKIIKLKQESNNTSYFGLIKPFCDFDNIKNIFVVTAFSNSNINTEDSNFTTNILGQSNN